MKMIALLAGGLIVGVLAACEFSLLADANAAAPRQPAPVPGLEVPGRTRLMICAGGSIASPILRPVVEVLVGAGDRVAGAGA